MRESQFYLVLHPSWPGIEELTRRLHELARAQDPSLVTLPPAVFELHSGGLDELIRQCLLTRGAGALPELAEPMIAATLAILGGRSSVVD